MPPKVATPAQSQVAQAGVQDFTDLRTGQGGKLNKFSRTRSLTRFEREAMKTPVEAVHIYNRNPIFAYAKDYPGLGPLSVQVRPEDAEYFGPITLEKSLVRSFDGGNRIQRLMVEVPLEIVEDFFVCSEAYPGRPENNLKRFGFFYTVGETIEDMKPPEKQAILDEAELKMRNWMHDLVSHADSYYNSANMQYAIVEVHKKAALYLHKVGNISELPDWVAKRAKLNVTDECRFCGFDNKRGVAVCRNCREVLDQELYDKLKANKKK